MRLFCFITSQVTNSKLAARAQNYHKDALNEVLINFPLHLVLCKAAKVDMSCHVSCTN